jgi:hypothetical protein
MWKKLKVTRIERQPSPIQITIDKKQPENVEYFNHLGVVIRCTREIMFRIAMTKAEFNKKKKKNNNLFTSKLDLNCKEETSKILRLEHSFVWY